MKMKKSIKNRVIICILRFMKIFQNKNVSFDKKNPRILVVSTTALGDSLWATPAIADIRKKYKNGYIACLCSKMSYDILENNKNINRLYILKKNLFSFLPLFLSLRKKQFQAIIILHASQRLVMPLCYLLNASIFAATEGLNKGLDCLLSHKTKNRFVHEIDRRFDLLKYIDVKKTSTLLSFYFDEDKKFIEKEINKKVSRPLIIFHPGAKDLFRVWHKSSYITLGQMLHKAYGCTIAITGNKSEEKIISEISKHIPHSITYPGTLNLNKLATLYKNADLFISGDTGPMHLACCLKTKVIALFVATDPNRYGPYGVKDAVVIKKEQTCYPCLKRKCKTPDCFFKITPDEVFDKCKKKYIYKGNHP